MVNRHCSKCGKEIAEGRRFCGGCGQAVPEVSTPVEPEPGIVVQPTASACANCGAPVTPGKSFCKQCGHAVGAFVAQPLAEMAAPESSVAPCTSCGRPLIPGKRFCKHCGHPIPAPVPLAKPIPDIAPDSKASCCAKCGASILAGKRFCRQCGHPVDSAIPAASIATSPAEQWGASTIETDGIDFRTGNDAQHPLKNAAPEQTLTAPLTAESFQNQPGLLLQAMPEAAPHEPLVRDSEQAPEKPSGKESPLGFTELNGLVKEESVLSREPVVISTPSNFDETESDNKGRIRSDPGASASTMRRNQRLLIGALGAVVAVIAIAALIFVHYHRRTNSARNEVKATSAIAASIPSAAQATQSQASNPASGTGAGTVAAPAKPSSQKMNEISQKAPPRSNKPSPINAKPKPAIQKSENGNCNLDSNILPKMLDQAERNREQGNYSDAARQYRSVLACDQNNARARSGLELTLLDIQHQ